MTAEAVVQSTDSVAASIAALGGEDHLGYPTNPRATAVAWLLVGKLQSLTDAEDVPLEDLVTPDRVPEMRRLLDSPAELAEVRRRLQHVGLVMPRVRPQPDGRAVVLFVYTHPEATEPALLASQEVANCIWVWLRLVEGPDDWRVDRIDLPA